MTKVTVSIEFYEEALQLRKAVVGADLDFVVGLSKADKNRINEAIDFFDKRLNEMETARIAGLL